MKAPITYEVESFLQRFHIPIARLADYAGVNAVTISRVLSGSRRDMASRTADKLRAAMHRMEQNLSQADPVATPTNSPEPAQEACHE